MVRAYERGVPALDEVQIAEMRRRLETAAASAGEGDLIGALAGIHEMHSVVYAATGNPEFERALRSIGPRFDRVLHLWYTDSITQVGSSYRRDLIAALERGKPDEGLKMRRTAWRLFRGVVAERDET